MVTTASYLKTLAGLYLPEKLDGQGMVEYGLILVLVALAVIALLAALGTGIGGVFTDAVNALGGATGDGAGDGE